MKAYDIDSLPTALLLNTSPLYHKVKPLSSGIRTLFPDAAPVHLGDFLRQFLHSGREYGGTLPTPSLGAVLGSLRLPGISRLRLLLVTLLLYARIFNTCK